MTINPLKPRLVRLVRVFVIVAIATCGAVQAFAGTGVSRLRLRASVMASDAAITLGDVLVFGDADSALVAKLAGEAVFADERDANRSTLTHEDVVRRLTQLDVNPASVLIDGASVCRITVEKATTSKPAQSPAGPGSKTTCPTVERTEFTVERDLARRASVAHDPTGPTLADQIRELINREMAALGGVGEIAFERAGREYLDLAAPFEFEIRPADREKLGVREFRVTVKRDGKVQRTATVAARVRLVRDAVVAKRPLSIGNLIREGDVGLEPQLFDRTDELGLSGPEQAIGRQVTTFVPAGGTISADGLKAVDLVQRSKPITVLNGDGGVQMRLAGIALDAGAYGDTIRVRLGEGRSARDQVQAVVVGVNTVRLGEVRP